MSKPKVGVIFNESDYVGFLSRLIIMIVDLIFVLFIFFVGDFAGQVLYLDYDIYSETIRFHLPALISFLYLTLLKASTYGTIGQKLTNTKILHINGKRPNILVMTYRLLFWVIGPFNLMFDFAWLTLNKEKRTLRDSLCNTIVVKKNAKPISTNEIIRYVRALVFGFNILYATAKP